VRAGIGERSRAGCQGIPAAAMFFHCLPPVPDFFSAASIIVLINDAVPPRPRFLGRMHA